MYDLYEFIGNYVKHAENKTYGDINKIKEDKIKSMLSDKELAVYEQIKEADKQRLIKFQ